jgi:predicted nucleotidyltransferase
MDRERILGILREHEPELRAAGVAHLRLFGSVARGDNTSSSDVDLLADFDQTKPLTLQSVAKIEYQLDDLLGVKVDLSSSDSIYPRIRARALAEAIVAF